MVAAQPDGSVSHEVFFLFSRCQLGPQLSEGLLPQWHPHGQSQEAAFVTTWTCAQAHDGAVGHE